jgi:outer membrane receptor protein involved in Fe transport
LFALQPGTYQITYNLQGFKPMTRQGIVVQLEMTVKVDIILEMGALEEEVTVIGQSPLIDVKSTVKGMTLTKEMFEVLPRGRNFDTLATAVPGVNYEPWLGGLSVDGASGAENMFYMDGTEINTTQTGVRGQSAAFEFVDEVQIKASGYPAEYGGALGGVVSVVTRQGGNEFHGEVIARGRAWRGKRGILSASTR